MAPSLTSLVLLLPPGFLPQVKSVVLFSCQKFITLDRNRVSIKPLEWKWVVDDNQPDPSHPSHRSSSRPETSSTLCREGQSVQSITSLSSAAASLHLNSKLNSSEFRGCHVDVGGSNCTFGCGLNDRFKE